MRCVCGHAEFLHAPDGCLRYFLSCRCSGFTPDDDHTDYSRWPPVIGEYTYRHTETGDRRTL